MPSYETEEADVLVVGAGAGGLWAAIRATDFVRKVVLVEKGTVGRSGVSVFCHGYLAPMDDRSAEEALADVVQRSTYLVDQNWARIVLEENTHRVADMERWGVVFEKEGGKIRTEKGSRGWNVSGKAQANGQQLMGVLKAVARSKGVQFVERVMITDILTSDGRHPTGGHVVGAVGLDTRRGTWRAFAAKTIVLNTGLISGKLHLGYADNVTGDGQAMAYRAGAELCCMELSPSCAFSLWNKKLYTGGQAQFQVDGARLVNNAGQEFLKTYKAAAQQVVGFESQPDFGNLCRAIAIEIMEGRGPVYFDLRKWSVEKINRMRRVLPFTMAAFDGAGVDLTRDMIETTPVTTMYATSSEAGLRVNPNGETAVRGLYAAGANAFMGKGIYTQSVGFVGGYRAGEDAGKRASAMDFSPLSEDQVEAFRRTALAPLHNKQGTMGPEQIYYRINRAVTPYNSSLFKEEKRILDTLEKIRRIASEELPRVRADDVHGLIKANEARNFPQLMELVYTSALARKESRLTHYREEYPYRDDQNWLKWTVCRRNAAGKTELSTVPVEFPYRPPAAREVVQSNIQYKLS